MVSFKSTIHLLCGEKIPEQYVCLIETEKQYI